MTDYRQCSRPGCDHRATATLRYNYAARSATVMPLEPGDDPHSWDLCERHLSRLSVPVGWDLKREDDLFPDHTAPVAPSVGGVDNDDVYEDEDFTDEEMQALAAALENSDDSTSSFSSYSSFSNEPVSADGRTPGSAPRARVVRRTDIPQPSGHHPSRRNLPGRAPQRHLRAVNTDGQ